MPTGASERIFLFFSFYWVLCGPAEPRLSSESLIVRRLMRQLGSCCEQHVIYFDFLFASIILGVAHSDCDYAHAFYMPCLARCIIIINGRCICYTRRKSWEIGVHMGGRGPKFGPLWCGRGANEQSSQSHKGTQRHWQE